MKALLAIVCTGKQSLHREWAGQKGQRGFDLMVLDYSSCAAEYEPDADYYMPVRGFKAGNIHEALIARPELLSAYEYFWLVDDDIRIHSDDVLRLVQIARANGFQVCQPALKHGADGRSIGEGGGNTLVRDLDYHHRTALWQGTNILFHYTNFIEIQMPLFTQQALRENLSLFTESYSGYGIDHVYSSRYAFNQLAVVDAVAVEHVRALKQGELYVKLKEMGVNPYKESLKLMSRHGLTPRYLFNTSIYSVSVHATMRPSARRLFFRYYGLMLLGMPSELRRTMRLLWVRVICGSLAR